MGAGGSLLVGTAEGLARSADGCAWSFAAGDAAGIGVIDLAVRPDDPNAALVLANGPRLFATADDGAHASAYGVPLDAAVKATTVEVAKSDPRRAYVAGTRFTDTIHASLFVSYDDGAHWAERVIPIDPSTEQGAYIAGVDPNDADRVYVRVGLQRTRLLVTDDAGLTFRTAYQGGPMLGFVLSADGATVYLGGPDDGLRVAGARDLAFTQRANLPVGCLGIAGATLYACVVQSAVLLAASTDDATFTPALRLADVRGPLVCPAGSSAAACGPAWEDLAQRFGIGADAGADASDAGPDASGGPLPGPIASGASCAASPPAGDTRAWTFSLLAATWLVARAIRRGRDVTRR
jgi:hypothetical protein